MSSRPPFSANARISPAAAALQQAQSAHADAGENRFEAVLAEARNRIRGQFSPAQIEDPSDADYRLAESIVRPLIESMIQHARGAGETLTREADSYVQEIMDTIFGFGVLSPYLADEGIEELIVNGPNDIWIIHAQRGKEKAGVTFRNADEVRNFVNRAVRGKGLSNSNPQVDGRMRDGSRLHAIMAPLTVNVPIAVTIRRHRLIARTLADLERLGSITPQARAFLELLVKARINVVIAGGTASGKTNFLNALANAADDADRFLVVEDTPEIQIAKRDVIQMTTRDQAEQARSYTIADLIIQSLRMRPDRILTGEARGPEIVDVLTAANTGHDGQMLTLHANSTQDVIQRMETMYLMRGVEVPILAIRRQIADAFQAILYLKRVSVGGVPRRFVTEIAEIAPSRFMEDGKVVVQNVFEDRGQGLAFTGYFPDKLATLMKERGVILQRNLFTGGRG